MFEDIAAIRYPEFTAKTVLLRMVESLGYRFNRAVIGIQPEHLKATPVPGGFPLDQLIIHIGHLIQTLSGGFKGTKPVYSECTIEMVQTEIAQLYEVIARLDDHRIGKSDLENAFYLLNGPLSDALWHMGQIAVYKRLLGIQAPNGGYYKGQRV